LPGLEQRAPYIFKPPNLKRWAKYEIQEELSKNQVRSSDLKIPPKKRQYNDAQGFLAQKSLKSDRIFTKKTAPKNPLTLKRSPTLTHKSIKMDFFWLFSP